MSPSSEARHAAPDVPKSSRRIVIALAAVSIAVLAGGITLLTVPHASTPPSTTAPVVKRVPLDISAVTPANNDQSVPADATVTVSFTHALIAHTPLPTLSPSVPGHWAAVAPNELEYVTTSPLVPGAQMTIKIPGGAKGVESSDGERLDKPMTVTFSVDQGSTLRLQQLLAQLNFLPLSFTATTAPNSAAELAEPQEGTFAWRWANQPASLTNLWTPGMWNVITKGAVMSFESQHHLAVDGIAGPQVWTDLLADSVTGATDPEPYGYVYVNKTPAPEMATVYQNGVVAQTSLANTGVTGATTPDGTWPVYLRFQSTTMTGTNPDGTKYKDPGIPWVSYFTGNDALHGYPRATYGFPQSDGCVELPINNAALIWPLTPIGTLVTVQ